MSEALPVECPYSQRELVQRERDGVPAENAAEYLARVRLQASKMPRVIAANESLREEIANKEAALPKAVWKVPSPIKEIPLEQTPSTAWREGLLETFLAMKAYVSRWEDLRFGETDGVEGIEEFDRNFRIEALELPKLSDSEAWKSLVAVHEPRVSLIMELDQKDAVRRFKDLTYDIVDEAVEINSRIGAWLYALLVRVETPLNAGAESHMRQLLRHALEVRNSDNQSVLDPLIFIIRDYFRV